MLFIVAPNGKQSGWGPGEDRMQIIAIFFLDFLFETSMNFKCTIASYKALLPNTYPTTWQKILQDTYPKLAILVKSKSNLKV